MTEQKAPPLFTPSQPSLAKAAPGGDWLEGKTIGKYKLVKRIGAGAFASIYEAVHIHLQVPFAIKVLHPAFAAQEEIVKRFFREAQAASQLQHENVIFIADFEVAEDIGPYIVMEYLEGETLKSHLAHHGSLPLETVGDISRQICLALAMAHQKGIIHRDLKPENIFLIPRRLGHLLVKVLDFGIAHLTAARESITGAKLMGTPVYMAPEQFRGQVHSPSLDIYSFGVILYEMLIGQPPFQGQSVQRLGIEHLLIPAPELDDRFPQSLRQLQARLLGKTPEERPAGMEECWKLLADAIDPQHKHPHWHQENSAPRRSSEPMFPPISVPNTDTIIAQRPSFPGRSEDIATEKLAGFGQNGVSSSYDEAQVSIAVVTESHEELLAHDHSGDLHDLNDPDQDTSPPEITHISPPPLAPASDDDNESTARYFFSPPTQVEPSTSSTNQDIQPIVLDTEHPVLQHSTAPASPSFSQSAPPPVPEPVEELKLEDHPALRTEIALHLDDPMESTLPGKHTISSLSADITAPGTLQPPVVSDKTLRALPPPDKESPDPTGKTPSPFAKNQFPELTSSHNTTLPKTNRFQAWFYTAQTNFFRMNRREKRLLLVVWVGVAIAIASLYFFIASEMWNSTPSKSVSSQPDPRVSAKPLLTPALSPHPAQRPRAKRRYALFQHVGIMTVPPGAEVFINNERMGQTPLKLLLEVNKTIHIRLQKTGFLEGTVVHSVRLVPEGSDAVMYTLQKSSASP